ncbi:MAG: YjbF family lipoprotein [Pseudomonadota bacterium]
MMAKPKLLIAATALVALAACGNDPTREGAFALAQSIAASTVGPLLGFGNEIEPAVSTPEAIAAVLPQLPPGPVLRIEIPNLENSAIAFQISTRAGYRTFATVTGQTVTTRDEIVTSTRGFAWDIMSSATNGATQIIRRRGSGTVQRIYRYLSPMDDEFEVVATCTISPDGGERITLASGAQFSTTRMREVCQAEGESFTNLYWVTSGGNIPRSHQRISEEVGVFEIEVIRN